ncbi:gamma-glutamyl-gamma-aminobutyrate hydrolase family protein [Roseococcus sp. DSY-14]|uniref:gamma-glutamyl-gamma-aminobutyrate hydrolase family protein n=1 Tax=Roseococcus sp. DSY-14 TaxID=3369650 RepID=UPI00387B1754
MKPLIGISCCVKGFGLFNTPNHAASDHYVKVVLGPIGGIPILIPAAGEASVPDILPRLDGLLLTGSRSNVHPSFYDGPAHAEGTPEDPQRDSTTLPLIRAAIAQGVPLLAICRGMQELNVALGGTLDQRIQDLPGRMDHSTPADQPIPLVRTGKAHGVRLADGTLLARLANCAEVPVNSLHNQGVQRLAPRLEPAAWAPDGTVEAVQVRDARAFAWGVQWHPEYDWDRDAFSRRIFEQFGAACAALSRLRLGQQAAE